MGLVLASIAVTILFAALWATILDALTDPPVPVPAREGETPPVRAGRVVLIAGHGYWWRDGGEPPL